MSNRQSHKSSLRGNTPIFIITLVLILIVAIWAYFLSTNNSNLSKISNIQTINTPVPSAENTNWITYANNTYGYSLSYEPNPIFVQRTCGSDDAFDGDDWFILLTSNPRSQYKTCTPLHGLAELQITIQSGDKTSEESIKSFFLPGYDISIEDIFIDTKKGKLIEAKYIGTDDSTSYQSPIKEARVFNNGYTYIITNLYYEEAFNQILSTFTFTK